MKEKTKEIWMKQEKMIMQGKYIFLSMEGKNKRKMKEQVKYMTNGIIKNKQPKKKKIQNNKK